MSYGNRMSTSPAPESNEPDTKKISFRFCREWYVGLHHTAYHRNLLTMTSSNLLYPKEDNTSNTLLFACRTCDYVENAGASCIYRNNLKETIAETPGNVDDVIEDPTVGYLKASSSKRSRSRSGYRSSARGYGDSSDDVLMNEDGEEEYQIEDSEAVDLVPEMCTLCGQEITCPMCGGPTDSGIMLETDDPEAEVNKKGQQVVEAEKRERSKSGAGM